VSLRPRRSVRAPHVAFVAGVVLLGAMASAAAATAIGRGTTQPVVTTAVHASPSAASPSATARATALPAHVTAKAAAIAAAPPPAASPAAPVPGPTPLTPLPGCPPPPSTPGPGGEPWHPDHLVPDAELPPAQPAAGMAAPLTAITGKGLWMWKFGLSENGNPAAIADRAARSGLNQVWVRVGDSQNGFYGADVLAQLVPAAHARGVSVIAWGFPYLYDPVADAAWTNQALAWRSASGDRIDGFSPDIETASEGVALSAQRVAVYLGLVRPARAGRPLVATVYPATDHWFGGAYPYTAMAPYVDAFAPMVYWECRDPGAAADESVARLAALKPVHSIGQAFSFAEVGGRVNQPGTAEIDRFLGISRRDGAVGASFWVWQDLDAEEWAAVTTYPWAPTEPSPARKLSSLGAPR